MTKRVFSRKKRIEKIKKVSFFDELKFKLQLLKNFLKNIYIIVVAYIKEFNDFLEKKKLEKFGIFLLNENYDDAIEKCAKILHKRWCETTKGLVQMDEISFKKIKEHWMYLWCDYEDLDDWQKENFKSDARRIINFIIE